MFTQVFFILLALFLGTYTDIKRHEVPDWINFGLIFLGVCTGIAAAVIYWDVLFFISSLLGLGLGFVIGWVMYYTGQWGGGDSKMIMGIGAMLGVDIFALYKEFLAGNGMWSFFLSSPFLMFLVCTIIIGAIYGLLWSTVLAIKHRHAFVKSFIEHYKKKRTRIFRYIIFFVTGLMLLFAYLFRSNQLIMLLYVFLAVLVYFSFYMLIAVKTVERVCMIQQVTPEKLTEGDWIAQDIVVDGKKIVGPKDLGISLKQIAHIKSLYKQGKLTKISVKYGIPFVPSFLMAYVVTIVLLYFL